MKEKKVPEPVALVDMDGTLCDWDGVIRHDYEKFLAEYQDEYVGLMEKCGTGVDRPKVDVVLEQKIKHLIRRQSGWYRKLPPLSLGFYIVHLLKAAGFRIVILTKSAKHTPNAWSEKVEWISQMLPEAEMIVTGDKGLVYGRVLVDDSPEHIKRWLEWRPRGLVIMPAQPWNQDFKDPKGRVLRVSDEDDVRALDVRLRGIVLDRNCVRD